MKSRSLLGLALLATVAGCSQTDKPGELGMTGIQNQQAAAQPAVMQGACPQIFLRDGTAVYTSYAKGGDKDPQKVNFQATLAATTRQCVQTESELRITVMAQGRIASGPTGSAGTVTLPIRVAASDGKNTLYSELTKFNVDIPADTGTAQFVFTNAEVVIPGGAGSFAKIYLGFDEGPYNTN